MYVTMLSWMKSSNALCFPFTICIQYCSRVLIWSECECSMQICNLCVVHFVEPPTSTAYLHMSTSASVAIPCYYIAIMTVHLLTRHSVKGSLYLLVPFDVWTIISPCASVCGCAYTIYIHRYVQVCVHVWDFSTDHAWRLNGSLKYSYTVKSG